MNERIYNTLLLTAIPLLMLCILPVQGISLRFSWQIVSIWIAAIAFGAWLKNYWWKAFFYLALFKIITGDFVVTSYIALMMIGIFLAAAQGILLIRTESVLMAMRGGALLLTAWMAAGAFDLVRDFGPEAYIQGPFNVVSGSVYLALCLPAFYRGKWVYGVPVIIAGIFWCGATTGAVAAFAGGMVFLVVRGTRTRIVTALGAGGIILLAIFIVYADPVTSTISSPRWEVWRQIILSFRSDWDGRGLGSFADLFPVMTLGHPVISPLRGEAWMHAHNEFLQVGFELGLQALAVLIAFVIWLIAVVWRRRDSGIEIQAAGMTTVIVTCLGWQTFHIAPLALLGCAWIGMMESEKKRVKKPWGSARTLMHVCQDDYIGDESYVEMLADKIRKVASGASRMGLD